MHASLITVQVTVLCVLYQILYTTTDTSIVVKMHRMQNMSCQI